MKEIKNILSIIWNNPDLKYDMITNILSLLAISISMIAIVISLNK